MSMSAECDPPMLPPKLPRQRLETITMQRPRCPACGGVKLRKYRSLSDQGDGSSLAWMRCLSPECGRHFRVVQT